MLIPPPIRKQLKKPLGRLHTGFSALKGLRPGQRIISVGDICTLGLLAAGIRPHLAVFDHRFMRRKLSKARTRKLAACFRRPKRYENPAGTLSEAIVKDAKKLIVKGGAVLIDGEEDLTALAFIRSAGARDLVVYGQPHKGIVLVRSDERIKKKIDNWLSAARNY
ncbi:DUF359 domain-containing protein [Candidatus Micrarchaeota archaeon]|nr:DUF359 domain-containing protein [Candidatus Micrarchaeota archaeon]